MGRTSLPKITELHKLQYTIETICVFMGLMKSDLDREDKPNMTTKDYTLHQFQCYVGRKKDELKTVPRKKFFN